MDLEKQSQKGPQKPATTSQKIYQGRPSKTFIPIEKNYAQEVCVILGVAFAVIGLVGLAGFLLGRSGMPTLGSIHQDRFLWTLIPHSLELGTNDHTLHLVFAGIFILGAALKFKKYRQI